MIGFSWVSTSRNDAPSQERKHGLRLGSGWEHHNKAKARRVPPQQRPLLSNAPVIYLQNLGNNTVFSEEL